MELAGVQVGWVMIGLALGLMLLGFPIAITMFIAGFLGMWLLRGWGPVLSLFGYMPWRQGVNVILAVVPLYIWLGALAAKGGIGEDAFNPLSKWVGQFRGGLTMAVATATAAFSAISGNHIACAATMSRVSFPELRKHGYNDGFSLAAIAASANLDIMIPPSGSFILFGFLTMTSIAKLFIAGILPGLFIYALIMIQIVIQTRINPSLAPAGPNVGWIERLKSTYLVWPVVLIFVIVLGGIYTGIFTPTESACFGCLAVIVVSAARRRMNLKAIIQSLRETLPTTAFIMLILIGGWLFGATLATSGLPKAITAYILASGLNPNAVMALILVVYIIAGCLTDIYAVLVVTLPIFFPVVVALGFDPLHFGVLCVASIMAGSISPPFAILAFALHGMYRDVPLTTIFRASIPFLITVIVAMFIIMFWPQLVTFLPAHMGSG
jgi:C4-dicarboxylate transporter DctM subunit